MLAAQRRVVVVDALRDDTWTAKRYARVESLNELSAYLAARWRGPFRVVYTPPPAHCAYGLHMASRLLFAYSERGGVAPVALGVDEMAESYSTAHAMTRGLGGFTRAVLQGRHIELSLYGATQRPQDVATRFRDNADRAYFFGLHDAAGRDAILRRIGREHGDALSGLKRFEFLEWREGKVTKGRTRRGA